MRRPLALKLYLALNSGQSSRDPQWTPSTDGDYKHIPVVWFHCEQAQDLSIVQALALRLLETRDDIKVVITTADIGEAGVQSPLALEVVPSENHRDVQAFLDHWSPDVGLWYGSNLRPALLDAAFDRDLSMVLIDGADTVALAPVCKSSRGVRRALLRQFDRILATSQDAQSFLKKLSAPTENVVKTDPVQIAPPALECDDALLQTWAEHLTNRPIWLAANTDPDDEAPLVLAHRRVLRPHHRLLLILAPRDLSRGAQLAQSLTSTGWKVAVQSFGEIPEDDTQIFVADCDGFLPIWYRLAPARFLGGTLGNAPATDPFDAANLGSALLHGPNTAPYAAHYQRFSDKGAARSVRTPDQIVTAVDDLLAPQRVAAMAHRAWDIITHGAEATDYVIELVETQLDEKGY